MPLVAPHNTTGAANIVDELIRTIQSSLEIGSVPDLSSFNKPSLQAMAVDELVERLVSLSFIKASFHRQLIQFVTLKGPSWFGILPFSLFFLIFFIFYFEH